MDARITAYLRFLRIRDLGLFLLLCAAPALLLSCQPRKWQGDQKLIILGIDGMDPELLKQFMAEGRCRISPAGAKGSFRLLTTSIPPQSPVAWSNLITGMNAGGHGIFDFIHRDPEDPATLFLGLARGRAEAQHSSGQLGDSAGQRQRRAVAPGQGVLGDSGRPRRAQYVFRIPANFPPVPAKGETLSGMGTPDLRGTYGTFSFYTDDPMTAAGAVEGGQIIPVQVEDSQVAANLIGPDNTFRKGSPPALEPFTVAVDPLEAVARIAVQDQEFVSA